MALCKDHVQTAISFSACDVRCYLKMKPFYGWIIYANNTLYQQSDTNVPVQFFLRRTDGCAQATAQR